MWGKSELDKVQDELAKMTDYNSPRALELMDRWQELADERAREQEKVNIMGAD